MTRKSVSLYYYTAGRPEEERSAPHDTLFMPGSNIRRRGAQGADKRVCTAHSCVARARALLPAAPRVTH